LGWAKPKYRLSWKDGKIAQYTVLFGKEKRTVLKLGRKYYLMGYGNRAEKSVRAATSSKP